MYACMHGVFKGGLMNDCEWSNEDRINECTHACLSTHRHKKEYKK